MGHGHEHQHTEKEEESSSCCSNNDHEHGHNHSDDHGHEHAHDTKSNSMKGLSEEPTPPGGMPGWAVSLIMIAKLVYFLIILSGVVLSHRPADRARGVNRMKLSPSIVTIGALQEQALFATNKQNEEYLNLASRGVAFPMLVSEHILESVGVTKPEKPKKRKGKKDRTVAAKELAKIWEDTKDRVKTIRRDKAISGVLRDALVLHVASIAVVASLPFVFMPGMLVLPFGAAIVFAVGCNAAWVTTYQNQGFVALGCISLAYSLPDWFPEKKDKRRKIKKRKQTEKED